MNLICLFESFNLISHSGALCSTMKRRLSFISRRHAFPSHEEPAKRQKRRKRSSQPSLPQDWGKLPHRVVLQIFVSDRSGPRPRLCAGVGTTCFTLQTCVGDLSLSSISLPLLTCAPLTLTSFSRLSRSPPNTCSMLASK